MVIFIDHESFDTSKDTRIIAPHALATATLGSNAGNSIVLGLGGRWTAVQSIFFDYPHRYRTVNNASDHLFYPAEVSQLF